MKAKRQQREEEEFKIDTSVGPSKETSKIVKESSGSSKKNF